MRGESPNTPEIIQYSVIALPLAFAGLPLYIHTPDFYAREIGLNLGVLGAILIFVRLVDAVQDPLIGYFSDVHAKRRVPVILAGIAFLTLGMAGLFLGPPERFPVAPWLAATMILATTGLSISAINLNTIGGFWSDHPEERTRIAAWREGLGLAGLLAAAVLPAALQTHFEPQTAFVLMFCVFAGLMAISVVLFFSFSRSLPRDRPLFRTRKPEGFRFLHILSGPDRGFFVICFLSHLAAALPAALVLFFIKDYLGAPELSGLFLVIYFVSGALFMPTWTMLARRHGKEKAWFVSMVLACATFVWAFTLQQGDVVAYGLVCFLSGVALGADLALPPSIMADRVSRQRTESMATQYFAVLTFIPKVALAIAAGSAFLVLEATGFETGATSSAGAANSLPLLYALVPCLIKLVTAALLRRLILSERTNYETVERSTLHGTADLP
ncbi:MAG: MFS transporter [Alphaproteobacteria bacterium]|nr:MFS transporter [Alphaproteobacteria bacterium]